MHDTKTFLTVFELFHVFFPLLRDSFVHGTELRNPEIPDLYLGIL